MARRPSAENPFVEPSAHDESEMPELAAPTSSFPPLLKRTPDGLDIREPVDQKDIESERRARMERAKRRRAAAIKANPFITDEVSVPLPRTPQDDPDWVYKWVRDMLPPDFTNPAGADTSNVSNHTDGRLAYEPVRLDILSEQWRERFSSHVRQRPGVEGVNSGTMIRYRDLVLMRTSRKMRDMQVEAWDYKADQLRGAVTRGIQSAGAAQGSPVRATDDERQGFVDFE